MKEAVRVLVADDDQGVLAALADLIGEDSGFELIGAAGSVDEAVAIATAEHPHVALIDVKMPDGGGQRLATELASIAPNTKIVAYSAFDDEDSVRSMVDAGAHGYFAKGREAGDVLATLRGVVQGDEVFHLPAGLMRQLVTAHGMPASSALAVFASVFRRWPGGIMMVGLDGQIQAANPTLCTMLGYREDELRRLTADRLTHPADRDSALQWYRDLCEKRTDQVRLEKRLLTRDGDAVWVDATSMLVHDQSGEPLYVITVAVDISERKQALAALHESEQQMRALVEGLPGVVYRCALDDLASTLYMSPQVEHELGYTVEEYVSTPEFWVSIIHPDDRQTVVREFTSGMTDLGAYEGEYRVIDAHGRTRWLRDHAAVVRDEAGSPLYCQGVMLDITDSKEGAEHRRADLAKSQFLASMSHEIRTPLNSVLGFAQLLESGEFGNLNDRQQRYVNNISGAGRHLLELVNDVLDLSKVQAGQMEFAVERLPVAPVLEDAIERMRPLAEARRVELRTEPMPSGLIAIADSRRVNQVLLNLLSNAVKFTPAGGSVTASARPVAAGVEIAVIDTGIGIPAADLDLIFDEFTQVKRGDGRVEGTGLGLAVSRSLMERMGGAIKVASVEGAGSTFTIRLPAPA